MITKKVKFALYGIGFLAILGYAGSYFYMHNKIDLLEESNSLYTERYDELKTQQKTILDNVEKNSKKIMSNLQQQSDIRQSLSQQQQEYNKRLGELQQTFNYTSSGERRDLEKLALSKPLMIERRINDASNKIGKELQNISNYDPRNLDNEWMPVVIPTTED